MTSAPFDHQRPIRQYNGQAPGMSALLKMGDEIRKMENDTLNRIHEGVE